GTFFEDDGHHRQPELGDGADLFHVGQTAHRRLDGEGDEVFDLFGSEPRAVGQHLDLYVGDVRHRVDGQLFQTAHAEPDDEQPADQHQHAVVQRKVDDTMDHAWAFSGCGHRPIRVWRLRT